MEKTSAKIEAAPSLAAKGKNLSNTGIMLLITIGLFVILYTISAILFWESNFAKFSVFFNFFNTKAYLLAISLGMTVVMITGSIDISIGSVTGLVSMVIAVMLTEHGINALWTIPASLGIGLAFGIVQGFLVAYIEIQPFIVTLSGMFFARGMISVIRIISIPIQDKLFMKWSDAKLYIPFLYNESRRGVRDIAYLTPAAVIALVVLLILIIVLKYTRFGRSLYAVGGSKQSALLMGIDTRKTKFLAHVICGLLAGIGGFCFTLFAPSGNPSNGLRYEMDAISSSVIGGAMLSGGVGLPIGTFFGVMINGLVARVVPMLGLIDAAWPSIITSAFLFAFIVLQSRLGMAGRKGGMTRILPDWMRVKDRGYSP
ncbi:MAG: sugar ABC transporter permease YjfF [Treponema sp.]|nr:sugar ABC transporter permease YjfF [Treponema sp.]